MRKLIAKKWDERGFVLGTVLACVFMLGLTGLAVLTMSLTALRVEAGMSESRSVIRDVDGLMEKAVDLLRHDPSVRTTCNDWGPNPITLPDISTQVYAWCEDGPPLTSGGDEDSYRVFDIELTFDAAPASKIVGRSRILVIDKAVSRQVFGYVVEICDWQIGMSVTGGELRAC